MDNYISVDILRKLYKDYQLDNMWVIDFGESTELQFLAQSISIGNAEIGYENIDGNSVAKDITYNNEYTIEFLETTSMDVQKYIKAWQNSEYDFNKKVFKVGKENRVKDIVCILTYYTLEGEKSSISYLMKNSRIKSREAISLSYEDSGPIKISLGLVCDYIEEIFPQNIVEEFNEGEEFGF